MESKLKRKNMKNVTNKMLCLLLACSTCFFFSCGSDDDDDNKGGLQEKYITVDNGIYIQGALPIGSNSEMLEEVTLGESVLPGGSTFLKLTSKEVLKTAYISVSGENGYIKVDLQPDTPTRSTQTTNTYTVIVSLSQQLNSDFTLELTAVNASGDISTKFTQNMRYVQAGTGDLQVNLSFDNAKDLDLYVVEPNGKIIYYGSPFPYCTDAYRRWQDFIDREVDFDEEDFPEYGNLGLDVDSNAGCTIDNINSENIFFKSDNMQKGKYQVWVNLFSNCDPSIATGYIVKATYKGHPVTPTFGNNPSSGNFPVGSPDNDIADELTGAVKVMEFIINEGITATRSSSHSVKSLKGLPKGAFKKR